MSDVKVPKREKTSFRLRHAQKRRRVGPLSFQWEQKQIERDYITYHIFTILITLQNKTMKAHKIIVKSLSKLITIRLPHFFRMLNGNGVISFCSPHHLNPQKPKRYLIQGRKGQAKVGKQLSKSGKFGEGRVTEHTKEIRIENYTSPHKHNRKESKRRFMILTDQCLFKVGNCGRVRASRPETPPNTQDDEYFTSAF